MTAAGVALLEGDVKDVRKAVDNVASDLVDELDALAPEVERQPTRARADRLNAMCVSMIDRLLETVHTQRPDLVVESDGQFTIVELEAWPTVAKHTIPQRALLSPWVASYGLGQGVAFEAISSLRNSLAHGAPLTPRRIAVTLGSETGKTHSLLHLLSLVQATDQPVLDYIADSLDLTATELGRLFGVKRQAIDQWRQRGIPADRLDKVDTVRRIVDLLRRYLRVDSVPAVARRPADRYGGRSMLDMIAANRHNELLEITAESFDFSATA